MLWVYLLSILLHLHLTGSVVIPANIILREEDSFQIIVEYLGTNRFLVETDIVNVTHFDYMLTDQSDVIITDFVPFHKTIQWSPLKLDYGLFEMGFILVPFETHPTLLSLNLHGPNVEEHIDVYFYTYHPKFIRNDSMMNFTIGYGEFDEFNANYKSKFRNAFIKDNIARWIILSVGQICIFLLSFIIMTLVVAKYHHKYTFVDESS